MGWLDNTLGLEKGTMGGIGRGVFGSGFDETMELGEDILTLGGASREKAAAQQQAQQQAQAQAQAAQQARAQEQARAKQQRINDDFRSRGISIDNRPLFDNAQVNRDRTGRMTEFEYKQEYNRHANQIKDNNLNIWGGAATNPYLTPEKRRPYDPDFENSSNYTRGDKYGGYASPELAAYGDIWNEQGDARNKNNPNYTPWAGNLGGSTNQELWDKSAAAEVRLAEYDRRKNNPTIWESVGDGLWSGAKAIADPFYEDSGEFNQRMADVESKRMGGKWVNRGDYKDWQKYNGY